MVGLDFLSRVEVLDGLDEDRLAAIQAFCAEEDFGMGDRIFSQDSQADHLWAIVEGRVDLHFARTDRSLLRQEAVTSIGASMPFGWSCMVEPYRYRSTAYAASSSCRVVKMAKENLAGLMKEDTKLGFTVMSNLTAVIARRFHQLQDELATQRGNNLISNW